MYPNCHRITSQRNVYTRQGMAEGEKRITKQSRKALWESWLSKLRQYFDHFGPQLRTVVRLGSAPHSEGQILVVNITAITATDRITYRNLLY